MATLSQFVWIRRWGNRQANRGTNTGSVLTRNVLKRDSAAKALYDALYD